MATLCHTWEWLIILWNPKWMLFQKFSYKTAILQLDDLVSYWLHLSFTGFLNIFDGMKHH